MPLAARRRAPPNSIRCATSLVRTLAAQRLIPLYVQADTRETRGELTPTTDNKAKGKTHVHFDPMPILLDPAMLTNALIGGVLIGASAGGLILVNGRIAGIAGILAGATGMAATPWQWAFVAGLVAAGLAATLSGHALPPALGRESLELLAVAGLLVGIGTRLGNGCTSGHGICGIARLSPRSLAATATFVAVAMATVFIVRHILGAP